MLDSAYPLSLISPATARTINSMFGEFQSPDPVLRLHPSDAVERGLQGGEMVRVWNDLGQITVRCAVDDALRPGVASMPKGAWIRAYGTDGVTVNALMPSTADELVGGACFNDARVEVEFIRSGE
jgi:anaerobic selenocysteine-containing dehydrogenase